MFGKYRLAAALVILLTGCASVEEKIAPAGVASGILEAKAGPKLTQFKSDRQFDRYLRKIERAQKRDRKSNEGDNVIIVTGSRVTSPPPPPTPAVEDAASFDPDNPEITNNQTVGVDEGGIIKQIGQYLVTLQDGRVFSIDLGKGQGTPLVLADRVDVYRNTENAAEWYDEMLVKGSRIIVTAYNYDSFDEGAAEITVLNMDGNGKLAREGRYLISSNDYYSTENYATRLVGDKLVFYTPHALRRDRRKGYAWPKLRRAEGDENAKQSQDMFSAVEIYRSFGDIRYPTLHAISICPLKGFELECKTTAFIGGSMQEFYLSPQNAFLWIDAPDDRRWGIDYENARRMQCREDEWKHYGDDNKNSILYRLPINGGPVSAIGLDGAPANQFSFESKDNRFRALLNRKRRGCLEQEEDEREENLALLDIPLSVFDQRIYQATEKAYVHLPPAGAGRLKNRFVDNWLLYGSYDNYWSIFDDPEYPENYEGDKSEPPVEKPHTGSLFATPLQQPMATKKISMPHNILRIERAGRDAVVTGYRDSQGLSMSIVSLSDQPRLAGTETLSGRVESENRSHAFGAWIKRDGSGVVGIPTSERKWRGRRGWSNSESSDLSFVVVGTGKTMTSVGELTIAKPDTAESYKCDVSCIDWYGNSRPIFTRGRIFALMGTELVEGALQDGKMTSLGRVDLTGKVRNQLSE